MMKKHYIKPSFDFEDIENSQFIISSNNDQILDDDEEVTEQHAKDAGFFINEEDLDQSDIQYNINLQ